MTAWTTTLQGLGTELDLDYAYRYSRHVSLTALVAYLKPGDGLTFGNLPGISASDDAITRVNLGATVKF